MAPISPSNRLSSGRKRTSAHRPRGRPPNSRPSTANGTPGPPLKKRKYIPGGPGGGGRYVDIDGTETPVGGTGPGGYNYTGSRGRVGRENAMNGVTPKTYPRRARERVRTVPTSRFSSAAAAAAAVVQGDGYKPREERGWEEFHPHLDIEAKFMIFSAEEVDGIATASAATPEESSFTPRPAESGMTNGHSISNGDAFAASPTPGANGDADAKSTASGSGDLVSRLNILENVKTPLRRGPGRPPRRESSMNGLSTPRVIPLPGPNPRERLTLPKPSFRKIDPFEFYEQKSAGQQRYVDRSMASVGYQESDIFHRPESKLIRVSEGTIEEDLDLGPGFKSDGEATGALGAAKVGTVEYDMDEQDDKWLAAYNAQRKETDVEAITRDVFEITMTKIEKEWHALEKRIPKPNSKPPQTHRPRSSSAAAVNGEPAGAAGEEQDSKCAICDDGDCENTNAIVFCDGCDLAVHQECYGVPFIPEGQWLCRKCQLIGRGTPTCIFCPNIEGAFKQTTTSRWSHLLCAIWIPEVSLGNPTFQEPVMDVEKIPSNRWKLTCYICRQKMGACIQCGNKSCYVAFHVTCARRARLFLKMKPTHGGPANFDSSVLKAYCDKHVPQDWRRENDVDAAFRDAQDYYRHTMRHRLWADSQTAACAIIPSNHHVAPNSPEESTGLKINLVVGGNKRKRNQGPPKPVWRLPSGAPVIPQVLYNAVESSMARFNIRKRKEYIAEACKFWTLKREARRGAALLKRLQLQMENFSSMEITRRNFVGMGAAGGVRLQRRIDFAHKLKADMEFLKKLCAEVRTREEEKLKDARLLKNYVDTVYFPLVPLLWPVLDKANSLDGKGVFRAGLSTLRGKLEKRFYTTATNFTHDLSLVFSSAVNASQPSPPEASTANNDTNPLNASMASPEAPSTIMTTSQTNGHPPASPDQKEKKRLAKRIIRSIQPLLETALRSEADLSRKPFSKETAPNLDILFDNAGPASRRGSMAGMSTASVDGMLQSPVRTMNGITEENSEPVMDVEMRDADENHQAHSTAAESPLLPEAHTHTPDPLEALVSGGIPWYMREFSPYGTSVLEEKWTGRDVVRGMSEELSEMDEEEMEGLAVGVGMGMVDEAASIPEKVSVGKMGKKGKRRR